ncbi:GNAT family N-acetyltransferase [Micromonospora sp. NPDC005305]|uniref:GNAT family N-acetyltransferase n=1 Tax=Micromonospora sp. NPDC005305 TaxID=3156875 RepID=UPI0033AEA9B7
MQLRHVSKRDAVALLDLLGELGYPTSALSLAARLERIEGDPSYSAWTVETDDGRLLGLVGGHLMRPLEEDACVAQLIILVVSRAARGTGVGRSLVEAFERWATQAGAGRAVVTSGAHRSDAHGFYRHLGFKETGKRFGKPLDSLSD